MPLGSQSLGSNAFGGLAGGAGNPSPDTQELNLTLHAPLIRIYSQGGTLAGLLTLETATPVVTIETVTQELTGTANGTTFAFAATGPLQALTLTLETPSLSITGDLSEQVLSATQEAPVPIVQAEPSTVTANVTAEAPIPTPTVTPSELSGSLTLESANVGLTGVAGTQALTGTLLTPIPRIYSLPATFAGLLTIETPAITIVSLPSTVTMTGTAEAPVPEVLHLPAEQTLTGTAEAVVPEIIHPGSTLNAILTLESVTTVIVKIPVVQKLYVEAGFAFHAGFSLQPRIVKRLRDPIVTGGCAQCGTLLWDRHQNAIPIASERVVGGLNFDTDGGIPDDRFVRCARCGFINNQNRSSSHPHDSRAGWGITYTEELIEANEPLSNQEPDNQWLTNNQPGV
jgi:hypothetical protein